MRSRSGGLLRRVRANYTVGYSYPGAIGAQSLRGTPNYNARIVIVGDPGGGSGRARRGFGVATGALASRSAQLTLRFSF